MTDQNTRPTPSSDVAVKIVDALFKDLRDRRFLKWLFSEQPACIAHFADGSSLESIDVDVQQEIRETWRGIIAAALSRLSALPAQRPSTACGCDGYSGDGCPTCEPHQHRTPAQVEVTDEMMKRATKAYHNAVISAPDETAGDRRQRVIRATLTAALTATDAKPEGTDWKQAFAAQSRKLQAVLHIPGVKETLAELPDAKPVVPAEPVGFARPVDVDPANRPFEGRTSFWVSEIKNGYYSEPIFAAPPSPVEGEVERLRKALVETLAFAEALEKHSSKGSGGRRGGPIFARARAALASEGKTDAS